MLFFAKVLFIYIFSLYHVCSAKNNTKTIVPVVAAPSASQAIPGQCDDVCMDTTTIQKYLDVYNHAGIYGGGVIGLKFHNSHLSSCFGMLLHRH